MKAPPLPRPPLNGRKAAEAHKIKAAALRYGDERCTENEMDNRTAITRTWAELCRVIDEALEIK